MRVALESTIVAHGLPWPDNLAVARELEATVIAHGAQPATIAVIDGEVKVGLTDAELERLARDGSTFVKAGATDLAVHLARGGCAATTVSATCKLAHAAGIAVFATGGIGGVHRGNDDDVSHDLVALARTPIAVISAGAKAILDLPRTLEHLETLGVLVIGYRCDEFPAFYTRSSGLRLEHRVDDIALLAKVCEAHWRLGGGGILVANPIPAEAAIDVNAEIERALASTTVKGKAITPYLLGELARITGGRSIVANRALAVSNAAVGAQLAVALQARGLTPNSTKSGV